MRARSRDSECWLVTGASSGIGRAAALQLAAEGADLILSGRDRERLTATSADARERGAGSITEVIGDVAVRPVHEELVRTGLESGCDGLFLAAGFSTSRELADLTPEEVEAQIAVNVRALTRLTRALTPALVERGRGFVLEVASLAGWQGVPTQSVYAATKAYVTSFTVALHGELRGSGVHVTALCPGLVRTGFFESSNIDMDRRFARLGSWDTPEEVARAALRGVRRNRMIVIPGLRNRMSPILQRFLPRAVVAAVARRMMEPAR